MTSQEEAIYDQYLRRLDARSVLDYYGAQNCTEQVNRRDGTTEVVHSCLLNRVEPHHYNDDANPSASCNVDKKKYVCYSLGWGGDLLHFIMKMEGKESLQDALSRSGKFLTEAVVPAEQLSRELERIFDDGGGYAINLPSYDESILNSWSQGHPYWRERGIDEGVIEMLNLGYDPLSRRLVFPHYIGGKLVGWQKRAIPGETNPQIPKYRSSAGLPRSESLYAHDLVDSPTSPVMVVESPMSVAKAYSLDIPNVVATFGSKVSVQQINLLKNHERVVVWFDDGQAGREGDYRLLNGLYRHTETMTIIPTPGKDLGDCKTVEEVINRPVIPASLVLGQYDLYRRR